ncbi:MAG: DUF6262 family protein [Actinoallomurus sp.]
MRADNTVHLRRAVEQRQCTTRQKAAAALAALHRSTGPVTVAGLARAAGVSRSWIYTQPELLQQTRDHQVESSTRTASRSSSASDASWQQRVQVAHTRIRELTAENKQLRDQIAQLHGQLRAFSKTRPWTVMDEAQSD